MSQQRYIEKDHNMTVGWMVAIWMAGVVGASVPLYSMMFKGGRKLLPMDYLILPTLAVYSWLFVGVYGFVYFFVPNRLNKD